MVLPDRLAADSEAPTSAQDKRSSPVADGDVAPVAGTGTAGIQERLVALMTQDMATFGAQMAGEGQFGWRDREPPARFDFFAT